MQTIRVLADDLTGALDSAAQFTGLLGPIPVFLHLPAPLPAGHAALDAGCRDAPASAAVAAMRQAATFLDQALAFKKIDSLLRGNWAAECAALLESGHYRSVVLAPAFPDQGRITRAGRQWIRTSGGEWECLTTDPAQALAAFGLQTRTMRPGSDLLEAEARTVLLADAATADDLLNVVAQGRGLPQPVLWLGSAGLARALAGAGPASFPTTEGPVLALIGSAHPAMLRQIEHAQDHKDVAFCPIGADVPKSAADLRAALDGGRSCLALFTLPAGMAASAAAEVIAARLGVLARQLPNFPTLMVAGGETLRALCLAAGAASLIVEGQFSPGVPRSRIVGGLLDGQVVVSKSGAFGEPDFLAAML